MTAEQNFREGPTADSMSVGDQGFLNSSTPRGLFEACNGNRYLVTDETEPYGDAPHKTAITLRHPHLRAFTYQPLSEIPLEFGTWRGPYRVRLKHVLPDDRDFRKPGTISVIGGYVTMFCRNTKRCKSWVSLGEAGDAALEIEAAEYLECDFDEWSIEALDSEAPFYERSSVKGREWVVEVR